MKIVVFICVSYSVVSSSPIVNGFSKPIEPNLGEFPFHASLIQLLDDKSYRSFCGGSLIHQQWVLTAAHCIQLDEESSKLKPNEVFIALGSVFRSAKGAQILQVAQMFIHPHYLDSGGRHDIGLIKLRNNAKLGNNVRLIKLHVNAKESLLNQTAYLTGFGIINDRYQTPVRLRKAVLHISYYNRCFSSAQYQNLELCASSKISEGKACKGDSGGPLFVVRNRKTLQIGITSHLAFLPICRLAFNNSVYTRVSAYLAWISKTTGINFIKFNQ